MTNPGCDNPKNFAGGKSILWKFQDRDLAWAIGKEQRTDVRTQWPCPVCKTSWTCSIACVKCLGFEIERRKRAAEMERSVR